ncbi:MAG: lytic transglycosylase domain-containing protein [Stellaceae bacterium]
MTGRYLARVRANAAVVLAAAALLPATPAAARSRHIARIPENLPLTSEIVTFGGSGRHVTVLRGPGAPPAAASAPQPAQKRERVEIVTFANPALSPVTVIRGPAAPAPAFGLFRPASNDELDRVAFAVEGVESGHGTNPAMWRPASEGPQGPMQVSAAAALDVGGGDRFDVRANRVLGRAFLAQMYQRYGNWPDALAAYNWGPGHVDSWIAAGRPEDQLPLETARYINMVLHDAVIGKVRL